MESNEVQLDRRTPEEREQYFYDKVKSGEMSINNFRLFLAWERMKAYQRGLDAALGALPEKHSKAGGWTNRPDHFVRDGYNQALTEARAAILKKKEAK